MKLIRVTTVPQSFIGLLKGQLKFISNNGFEVVAISTAGEKLDKVSEEESVRTIPLNMTRKISPLSDLLAIIRLCKILLNERPLLVHTHTPKAGLIGMVAGWICGIKFRIHTVAGMPLLVKKGLNFKLLYFVEKLTYSFATNVFPNSYGLAAKIEEMNLCRKDKLKVIGYGSSNGIDTNFFDPKAIESHHVVNLRYDLGIGLDDYLFLFVGRIVRDKGIQELLDAFISLNDENSKCHLVIVGNYERDLDPIGELYETIIDSHPNIHAVGYKYNVREYFAAADVLVFPSYREGFPNVVMQAAAMELNSIVTNINGCNEIITNGYNGWIIPVKSVDALVDRMKWCMENKEESKRMGARGRELMQARFERNFVWNEILKEYKLLISQL